MIGNVVDLPAAVQVRRHRVEVTGVPAAAVTLRGLRIAGQTHLHVYTGDWLAQFFHDPAAGSHARFQMHRVLCGEIPTVPEFAPSPIRVHRCKGLLARPELDTLERWR